MTSETKKKRIYLSEEQWEFVEKRIEEYRSDGINTTKEICEVVSDELKAHQMFKIEISGTKLLANYYNRMLSKKKNSKSLVVADPNDIRYILLIYGPSGAYKPTFHCDKEHLTRKVEEETTANGGTTPKMKIFSPITFKVNIEEVRGGE